MLLILGAAAFGLPVAPLDARVDARFIRYADVSETQLAFSYAGDIWIAPREGGVAERLNTSAGSDAMARFSPDGKMLAYSAQYDGNVDIYVLPSTGGMAKRITFHPGTDYVVDWSPEGDAILFTSSRENLNTGMDRIYSIPVEGGLAEPLPMVYAADASFSEDGKRIAYTPGSRLFRTWKRYRGGTAQDIYLFDVEEGTAENLTEHPANDEAPMLHGNTLYFLSDRGEELRYNLWKMNLRNGRVTQLTDFEDFDLQLPRLGPKDIVFTGGSKIFLMDLESEEVREITIEVAVDKAPKRPRKVDASDFIQSGSLSPNAKRALFSARGEVFSVPAEHGPVRNLTQTSGVAERTPVWSPDGKTIAYWSDEEGEYQLVLMDAMNRSEKRVVTSFDRDFRFRPIWSHDSSKLVFIDSELRVQIVEVESEKLTTVVQLEYAGYWFTSNWNASWSHDDNWLAMTDLDAGNFNSQLILYNVAEGELNRVGSTFYGMNDPAFDEEGDYLYVVVASAFSPNYGHRWDTWIYEDTDRLAAIPLRPDVGSPLKPRNDEEEIEENDEEASEEEAEAEEGEMAEAGEAEEGESPEESEEGDEEESAPDTEVVETVTEETKEATSDEGSEVADSEEGEGESEEGTKEEEPEPLQIDLEGFEERMVLLPVEPGAYGGLFARGGKLYYASYNSDNGGPPTLDLNYFDFEKRESETVMGRLNSYSIAAKADKALVRQGNRYGIIGLGSGQKIDPALRTGEMHFLLKPAEEWRQLILEAWRLSRDYFYDREMHGLDWPAVRDQYMALVDQAATRWDVNVIIGDMIGELNASHTYRWGGDSESADRRSAGLLGVEWEVADGHYRIAEIVDGAPWDAEVRSPLADPSHEVGVGTYVLAVNGILMDPALSPFAAFDGLNGETVELTVNDEPTMEGSRDILVETLTAGQEYRLRYLAWVNANREYVEEISDGQVGYIFVPNTGQDGQNELYRQFVGQLAKPALVIDERFNGGGQIPDRFIELLNRPLMATWGVRDEDSETYITPGTAHFGPKVMLINGYAGSGGDAFPDFFRRAGLGKLVGTRTWGGLIGISGNPGLIDGGTITVPTFRMIFPDGTWFPEGYGTPPDIEVPQDYGMLAAGTDLQLKRAVEVVLEELEENPPPEYVRPPREDRRGVGDIPRDARR